MMPSSVTHVKACLLICLFLLPNQTATAQSMAAIEAQIIKGTNNFRRAQGRKDLVSDKTLTRTAKAFACYMARTGNYGHYSDGRKPSQRAQAQGFPKNGCVGENIAWNNYARNKQANILTNGWINSPPHRKNMLTWGAKITGVAVCQQGNKFYGVQLIGRKNRVRFEIVNRTPYPVHYRYGQNDHGQPTTGTLPGHPNGWRSVTINICEYAKLTATQTRPDRFGSPRSIQKSKMMIDIKQKLIFGQ